ncbi:ABC transporter permease subunit [Modestobacter sp. VKM Ac-2986]|uniref:PhnE/PtxC family ABC transporter permease n=1 Tax=Modestobacter sp. VKM Ac-2986 TaxID=3004140 RepID=UPI0022AAE4CC|nr:ABC transporter permease subunit [Modestobacter sp. VKM Ac-2986]MCZ2828523.1 ABC transporter permease subunit [Modestobacter sp. VKM Ac-2986]
MTTRAAGVPALRRDGVRWAWGLGTLVVLGWSLAGAGLFSGAVVNTAGTRQFGRFAAAALSPATDAAFLGVLASSVLITVAYAALGAALAVGLGAVGAVAVARTTWGRRRLGWALARGALAVPRGLHEAVWGLLLVNLLGLDPWVGVLAIGIPYGAVTAKVFADLLDEVPRGPYEALRATGAGPVPAALYGLLPAASGGLLSYSFYRLECAVRSAVVLGLIGAGGLGYQLSLSFSSLRWPEVWSCVYALSALCVLAVVAGRAVRRRVADPRPAGDRLRRDPLLTTAVLTTLAAVAWSWWYLAVSPATLVSDRTGDQLRYVLAAAWPPDVDGPLLSAVASAAVDTVQMSVIAIAVATVGAVLLAGVAAHPVRPTVARRLTGAVVRAALLLLRAVPPPVWALVLLFVLLPGVLPGALALGVYTLGVLGRLAAEATEELDPRPRAALTALGASPVAGWLYSVLPAATGPVLAYALYRWEVAVRDTVLVGLLGAGGLGALLASRLAVFDWGAVTTVLVALVVLTAAVDLVSARARAALR